jgi:hypothetical protein
VSLSYQKYGFGIPDRVIKKTVGLPGCQNKERNKQKGTGSQFPDPQHWYPVSGKIKACPI